MLLTLARSKVMRKRDTSSCGVVRVGEKAKVSLAVNLQYETIYTIDQQQHKKYDNLYQSNQSERDKRRERKADRRKQSDIFEWISAEIDKERRTNK